LVERYKERGTLGCASPSGHIDHDLAHGLRGDAHEMQFGCSSNWEELTGFSQASLISVDVLMSTRFHEYCMEDAIRRSSS
jgi:hypothetical protein